MGNAATINQHHSSDVSSNDSNSDSDILNHRIRVVKHKKKKHHRNRRKKRQDISSDSSSDHSESNSVDDDVDSIESVNDSNSNVKHEIHENRRKKRRSHHKKKKSDRNRDDKVSSKPIPINSNSEYQLKLKNNINQRGTIIIENDSHIPLKDGIEPNDHTNHFDDNDDEIEEISISNSINNINGRSSKKNTANVSIKTVKFNDSKVSFETFTESNHNHQNTKASTVIKPDVSSSNNNLSSLNKDPLPSMQSPRLLNNPVFEDATEDDDNEDLKPMEILFQFIPYYGKGNVGNDSMVRAALSNLSISDIECKDNDGNSLLLLACQYKCEDLIRIILNKGIYTNIRAY